ncbi:MAG: hypothetical protein ACK5SQ_13905 [Chitinophagales bacterium]
MNRFLAHFLSAVGHPLFILTYVLLLMLAINPYAFGVGSMTDQRAVLLLLGVFFTTAFIPGIGVALMKLLGFAKSWQLADKQERIGPFILTGVFYIWLFKNLHSAGQTPLIYTAFVLGATISLFLCFIINIFEKISVHAAGASGLVTMLAILPLKWPEAGQMASLAGWEFSWPILLSIGVIVAGDIGVARLELGAHSPSELYRGYVAGALSIIVAVILLV